MKSSIRLLTKGRLILLALNALGVLGASVARSQTPVTLSTVNLYGAGANATDTFTPAQQIGVSYPNYVLGAPVSVTPTNGSITTNLLEGIYTIGFSGLTGVKRVYVPGLWITNLGYALPLNLAASPWLLGAGITQIVITNQLNQVNPASVSNALTQATLTGFGLVTNNGAGYALNGTWTGAVNADISPSYGSIATSVITQIGNRLAVSNNYNGTFSGPFTGNATTATTASTATFASTVSGSGAASALGTNQPFAMNGAYVANQNPSVDNWGAYSSPEVVFVFSPYPSVTTGVATDNELTIMTNFVMLQTNGWLAAITNSGRGVRFQIDIGWDARRNYNFKYDMTNMGSLTWDTTLFPDGMPWLINKLTTNGINVSLGIYGVNSNIPPGADGLCCAWSGNLSTITPYTNSTGPGGFIFTNNNFKDTEVMTTDSKPHDLSEIHWWGATAVIENDFENSPDGIQNIERVTATALKNTYYFAGFNQNAPISYFNINSASIDYSQTNNPAWYSNPTVVSFQVFFNSTMAYFPYEKTITDKAVYGDVTRKFHNGVNYENYNAPATGRELINYFKIDFAGATKASDGAYVLSANAASAQAADATWAMLSAVRDVATVNSNNIINSLPALTNAALNAIACDPLQRLPTLVKDLGVGIGTIWKKELYNGDVAVMVNSEAVTNSLSPAVTWDMLGLNTNDFYIAKKVYNLFEFGAWPATNTTGLFTNFIINVGGNVIIRLSKVPNASQLLGNIPPQITLHLTNGFAISQVGGSSTVSTTFGSSGGFNFMNVGPAGEIAIGSTTNIGGAAGVPLTFHQGIFDGGSGQWEWAIDDKYLFGRNTSDGLFYINGLQAGFNGLVVNGVDGVAARITPTASTFAGSLTATNGLISLNSVITNGTVDWFFKQINGTPSFAAPAGSICTTTNGQMFVATNNVGSTVWLLK
jgi:hypothetical protein